MTPGPWTARRAGKVLDTDARGQIYIHAKDVTIAAILDGEREGNASLIAAAPDLLQAAKDARALLVHATCPVDWLDAAIAKAEQVLS